MGDTTFRPCSGSTFDARRPSRSGRPGLIGGAILKLALVAGFAIGAAAGPGAAGLAAQAPDVPSDSAASSPTDSLRADLRLPVPPQPQDIVFRPVPAMGANSPGGFGARWGDAFVGVAYQANIRNATGNDGAVAAGVGLGNPWSLVGLDVAVVSFSTFRSGWGERMGVDFKVHRILPGLIGIAVGWESALLRGDTDGLRSRYAAASKWFQLREDDALFSALVVSAGVGNGRFVRPDDRVAGKRIGYFGSVAVRVAPPFSIIADWTGQDLALATSVAPFDRHSVVFVAGFVDLTGTAGDDGARFVISASYGFRFRPSSETLP